VDEESKMQINLNMKKKSFPVADISRVIYL